MMPAYRLLRLVETHSDALAAAYRKTQNSALLPDYRKVSSRELRQRVQETTDTSQNGC